MPFHWSYSAVQVVSAGLGWLLGATIGPRDPGRHLLARSRRGPDQPAAADRPAAGGGDGAQLEARAGPGAVGVAAGGPGWRFRRRSRRSRSDRLETPQPPLGLPDRQEAAPGMSTSRPQPRSRNPLSTRDSGFRRLSVVGAWMGSMTATAHHAHRVTGAVAAVRDQLVRGSEVPLWSMDAAETTAVIEDVLRAEAQLAELEGPAPDPRRDRRRRRTRWCDLDGELAGPTSTHTTRRAAHRTVRLAEGPRGPRADPRRARGRGWCRSSRPRRSSAPSASCPPTSTPTRSPRPKRI